jgi:type VII secretion-associated serine protease mycosin
VTNGLSRRAVGVVAALLLGAGSTLAIGSPAAADAARSQQWYLSALGIPAAQAISQGDGVTVAVIDTGVAANQPDLVGSVLPGADTTPGSTGNGQNDTEGHGTRMAAIIAGHGHGPGNADGVLGIAPRAKILPIKLGENKASVPLIPKIVAAAIDAAVAHGAKVINASFGADLDEVIHQAVLRALDHDVVFVASGGNTGTTTDVLGTRDNEVVSPAFFPGVLAVCGTDRNGNHAAISIPAPAGGFVQFAVCAPAVGEVGAQPDGTYIAREGTSMSAAIVSGVAALIRARYPTMPAYEVAHRITATATPKGDPRLYGHGIVNPVAALTAAVPPTASPSPWISHSPTPPAPATSAPGSRAPTAAAGSSKGLGPAIIAVSAVVVVLLGAGVWIAIQRRRRPR